MRNAIFQSVSLCISRIAPWIRCFDRMHVIPCERPSRTYISMIFRSWVDRDSRRPISSKSMTVLAFGCHISLSRFSTFAAWYSSRSVPMREVRGQNTHWSCLRTPRQVSTIGQPKTTTVSSACLVQMKTHADFRRRKSACVFICTKQADDTVVDLGWPIVDTWRGVRKHDQCVFWPRTSRIGTERDEYQAAKVENLLSEMWQPKANTVIDFDEMGRLESLSTQLRKIMLMYVREGRSHGITCILSKQRIQGAMRDMHSETDWKIAFRMNDREDN